MPHSLTRQALTSPQLSCGDWCAAFGSASPCGFRLCRVGLMVQPRSVIRSCASGWHASLRPYARSPASRLAMTPGPAARHFGDERPGSDLAVTVIGGLPQFRVGKVQVCWREASESSVARWQAR